ncbi:MAG: AAA family ATPase, partial [Clostridia bacterium]|nr:AAA family ATPase [Clostridia bacterium]
MAQKTKSIYICSECGYESPKWNGCCPGCGEWNTMNEEIVDRTAQKTSKPVSALDAAKITDITYDDEVRINTGIHELNRVLGGGIVIGSLVLLCGDPGIGKSTLLLQICEYIGKSNSILYVSGEESARQIKLRANRLEVNSDNLSIMCGTDINAIINYINTEKPGLVIIDSIQTMSVSEIASAPGSVTQVRESTNLLMQCAKSLNIPVFIVGHVNKDGNIAGPKVLEHIV